MGDSDLQAQSLMDYYSCNQRCQSSCPPTCDPCCPPAPCHNHCPPPCPTGPAHPCPTGPTEPVCPDLPNIKCTHGLTVYLNTTEVATNVPITIPNGFNPNDGTAPWTITQAEFTGTQQTIYNLQDNTTAQGREMTATVKPTVLVSYLDGSGANRTKLVNFPVAVSQQFAMQNPADQVAYHVELLPGGTITNPTNTDGAISFTASYTLRILAYSDSPANFPIVQGYTCEAPPPCVPIECVNIAIIDYYCEPLIYSSLYGNIPYTQVGTPPNQPVSITPIGSVPNVISTSGDSAQLSMALSFPATLVLRDSTNANFTQDVLVYSYLDLSGVPTTSNNTLIVDLKAAYMSTPSNRGSSFSTYVAQITGRVMVLEPPAQVPVTSIVDCGECLTADNCYVGIEPTTAP